MTVAVDTNILLDILLADPDFLNTSKRLLFTHLHQNLIISEAVYAELATAFPKQSILDNFLGDTQITMTATTKRGLWLASRGWKNYSQRRKVGFQCATCGHEQEYKCKACAQPLTSRQHIIADFIIAGHALEYGGKLLSRDRGFYRSYFPELKVLN